MESASSPFTTSGTLTEDAILGASPITAPQQLKNTNVPAGSRKYTTKTYNTPSGDMQVHFYKNPTTGEVFYGFDHKAIFNNMFGFSKTK